MTTQDYIFSAVILCLALALLWGLVVARRADRDNPDLESDRDRDREPGDDDEPDLNAESGRERQLRDYRDKYR